jgi:hypothetical protein
MEKLEEMNLDGKITEYSISKLWNIVYLLERIHGNGAGVSDL